MYYLNYVYDVKINQKGEKFNLKNCKRNSNIKFIFDCVSSVNTTALKTLTSNAFSSANTILNGIVFLFCRLFNLNKKTVMEL